jgi:hypothetical protein
MTEHSAEYTEYMHSAKWSQRKQRLYHKRGYVCETCGAVGVPLDVHHKNYDRLGHELDDDLLIVCRDVCHPKADRERVEWEASRVSQIGMKWATLEEVEELTMKIVNTKTTP